MKVIDLLNKIANEEEVPKRIKLRDNIYEFDFTVKHYICVNSQEPLMWQYNGHILNAEIELIEENQDIDIQSIEELDMCKFGHNNTISQQEAWYIEKVNELIQAIKQLDRQINNN